LKIALEALNAVQKEFSVDAQRLYLTGLSMGGFATWDCITRHPDRFAAAAPICGGGDESRVTTAVAKVPVWAFHSFDDNAVKVKFTRIMIDAMRAAGGSPKYFEYIGAGHASWNNAFAEPEFLPWMFAQRLGRPDTYAHKTKAPELPAAAHFPEVSAFPGQGPLRTSDWFRELWCERRGKFWLDRERDRGAIVFLGDSITQGWGKRLEKEFPKLKVANRGISGDVTRGVLYRLKEDVLDLDPKAVVLLIGTNDLEENADPATIAGNIKLILDACKMPVIVCKVMPSHASKKRPSDKIQQINALIEGLVKANPRFILCDTYSIFANAEGDAKPQEFPDLLHPNTTGYTKFAAALRPILEGLK
jgi:lysophospholipase L1-like esterase/dienelactone hydrolase